MALRIKYRETYLNESVVFSRYISHYPLDPWPWVRRYNDRMRMLYPLESIVYPIIAEAVIPTVFI